MILLGKVRSVLVPRQDKESWQDVPAINGGLVCPMWPLTLQLSVESADSGFSQGEYHTEAAAALAYDRAMLERDGPDSLTNAKVFGQALLDGQYSPPA
jgi:hypothetical protein